MPSIPISPFGGSNGGVCGPYNGWWKGHAHWPGHWLEELPTQMKVVPVLWSEPWTAQMVHAEVFNRYILCCEY